MMVVFPGGFGRRWSRMRHLYLIEGLDQVEQGVVVKLREDAARVLRVEAGEQSYLILKGQVAQHAHEVGGGYHPPVA